MNISDKTKEQLIKELQELQQENNSLKTSFESCLIKQKSIEEKLHEKELEESIKEYRNLIDISPVAMSIVKDWKTIYFNPAAIQLFGAETESELLGKHIFELIHPDFQELAIENAKSLAEKGYVNMQEQKYLKLDGTILDVETQAKSIRYNDTNATLVVIKDITERKKNEIALAQSEERFKALHNASFGGIVIHDKGKILECNKGLSEITGYSYEELIGMDGLLLIDSSTRDLVLNNILTGYEKPYEAVGLRKNGELFPVRLEARNIPYKGKNVRTVEFRDITEIKKAEELLLKNVNRAKLESTVLAQLMLDPSISSGDIDIASKVFTEACCQVLQIERSSIWLFSNDNLSLECLDLFETNTNQHSRGIIIKAIDYPRYFNAMIKNGRISAQDAKTDERTNEFTKGYLVPLGITSMLDSGIFLHGKLIGLICIEHTKEKRVWNHDEESFASTISSLISQVIVTNEQKLAVQALKKSEERFKAIANYSASWETWINREGKLIWTNSYCEKITGYTAKEYLFADHFLEMAIAEMDLEKIQKILHDALNGSIGVNIEIRCNHKNGHYVWICISCVPIFDNEGNNIGIRTSSSDISERIEQDLKLRTSDRIFNHSIDMLCIAGFDGYFKVLNPAWSKTLGWSVDELLLKPWNDFVHPDDLNNTNNIKSVLDYNQEIYQFENRFLCKDGSVKWLSWNSFPYKEENVMFGVARDVTDQKAAEQELIEAKIHAEESDRLKSAFLANMSHEIRTPMNGILGFAELLKEPDLSGEEIDIYINIIEKSGIRMLNIINDIVDISKIEAGLMKLNINETNINEQIEYIYTFFKPEVEAKGLELSFNTPLSLERSIFNTDREKVYAILTNLVKNSIKYTENGSIEFGYSIKESPSKSTMLQFYVKDTGIGISQDRTTAIFERFIQADISDAKARQGAGLGLSITKAYVEMLGGEIWVESEEGTGSTFYFTLPYNTVTI